MGELISALSDAVCGYPLFVTLICGGLFLFFYSGMLPLRGLGEAVRALRCKNSSSEGEISSFEALMSAIAATIGMGNIAGVAIAITMGGPGAVFWMWVSAMCGMATKFFEGTLSQMYRHKESSGAVHGGMMYIITEGLGAQWRPLAIFFSAAGLVGTLCMYQANQLVESVETLFNGTQPFPLVLRAALGLCIAALVAVVILGGIKRISAIASRMVPAMVSAYFLLVMYMILTHLESVPGVFSLIFSEAFSFRAGVGGFLGVALIGARRAALVNEAGVGTASMMHGDSRNDSPVREGFVALLGPMLDSGIVCTLTALSILLCGDYHTQGVKGLNIALGAFENAMPGVGSYLLFAIVVVFAFSTMFSYSYYGIKCSTFLFGEKGKGWYNCFFLVMLVVAAIVPLSAVVSIIDLAYALMAFPTMFTLLRLAPKVKRALREYKAMGKQ